MCSKKQRLAVVPNDVTDAMIAQLAGLNPKVKKYGTREEVYAELATQTRGGLGRSDLTYNDSGKIVSRRAQSAAAGGYVRKAPAARKRAVKCKPSRAKRPRIDPPNNRRVKNPVAMLPKGTYCDGGVLPLSRAQLNRMTVAELRPMARSYGVTNVSGRKKSSLVTALARKLQQL